MTDMKWDDIGRESVELFKGLLALDTTNPPGNEVIAAEYLAESLREDGLEPWIKESAPGRANLVVRLPATVDDPKPPLLLAGHTDVVPANPDEWTHPPFAGTEADAQIWGRGAVDMKNMVTMSVMCAKLLARVDGRRERDLIVACVADEEEGCTYGSRFLVDEHPEKVQAEYMLGEVGGFWLNINGQTYVPVMVAEKGQVHLRMSVSGPTGHGAIPRDDNSLVVLAEAIAKLGHTRLPYHQLPVMANFVREVAKRQKLAPRKVLSLLLNGTIEGFVLDRVLPDPELSRNFGALFHNTVSPTIFNAGVKRNVIPGEASCDLDGRTLPGFTGDDLAREVARVVDDPRVSINVLDETPGTLVDPVESPLLNVIRDVVGEHAPHASVVPYMIPGFTDAKSFSRLGTKCYGFSPLKITPESGVKFSELFHGIDERVSVDGYMWGQRTLYDVVSRFLGTS